MNLIDQPEHLQKDRILIVEDSPTVRKVFAAWLAPKFVCVEAGSFDEAVLELKRDDFAVVITDIIMPGMSGIELLRRILTDFPETMVVVVSGVSRPQRVLDALRLGAFDYLIKPCEADVLGITVERALERRNLLVRARRQQEALKAQNKELTQQKRQLERLQSAVIQHEKMASLGQLAAGVAHELNNPVGFVYANLEMLNTYVNDLMRLIRSYDPAGAPPSGTEIEALKQEIGYPLILQDIVSMLADCREGSDRIREIVENLRTFSRIDEAEYKQTDIHEGIDSTIRLLPQYFSSGSIRLIRKYVELPLIGAFSGPLNQVWMNLLVNAAQAVGTSKGEVRIESRCDDENVSVTISDTGGGIAVQHLTRIFDPFFTTKPIGEGTGLGLSISFGIVERHGGNITVESRLKHGTSFEVRLPRSFEPEMSGATKSIKPFVQTVDATALNI